jgi:hypothetical protein
MKFIINCAASEGVEEARNLKKIKAQKSMYWQLPNLQDYML